MKLKIGITGFILFVLMFVTVQSARAQMGMMGSYYNDENASSSSQAQQQSRQTLQNMVNDILKSQNVSSGNQLDCSKINKDTLEKLGDTWMDVVHPNENVHEAMDIMMGGEGSESLANAHIQMAKNYLGCGVNGSNFWMPMMFGLQSGIGGGEFPMMGWGNYGYGTMMNGGFGWGFGLLGLLFWIVVFVDLVLLGIFLWKKIQK